MVCFSHHHAQGVLGLCVYEAGGNSPALPRCAIADALMPARFALPHSPNDRSPLIWILSTQTPSMKRKFPAALPASA